MYIHGGQRQPSTHTELYLATLAPLLSQCINRVCSQTDPNLDNRQWIYWLPSRYECSWEDLTIGQPRTRVDSTTRNEITVYKIHAPAVLTFGAGFREEPREKQWYTRPEVISSPRTDSPYVFGTFAGPGYALHLNNAQEGSIFEARSGMNDLARAVFSTAVSTPQGHSLKITQNDPHTWLSTASPPQSVEWTAIHTWSEWTTRGIEYRRMEIDLVLELRAPTFPPNSTISSGSPFTAMARYGLPPQHSTDFQSYPHNSQNFGC